MKTYTSTELLLWEPTPPPEKRITTIAFEDDPRYFWDFESESEPEERPHDILEFPLLPGCTTKNPTYSFIDGTGNIQEVHDENKLQIRKCTGGLIDYSLRTLLDLLPLELRVIVYRYVLAGYQTPRGRNIVCLDDHIAQDPERPGFLPALCHVCKGMLYEAAPTLIQKLTFILTEPQTRTFLHSFLSSIPDDAGYRAVRSLQFEHFDDYDRTKAGSQGNADFNLMSCCPGLRTIALRFHCAKLRQFDADGSVAKNERGQYLPIPISDLASYYDLGKLFDCDMLDFVILRGVEYHSVERQTEGDLKQVLHDLADWVELGFAMRGRSVWCEVTWH